MTPQEIRLSRQDAYCLARFLAGMSISPNGEIPNAPIAKSLLSNLSPSDPDHRQVVMKMFAGQLDLVLKEDPKGEPPPLPVQKDEFYVPPLPSAAELDDKAIAAGEKVGKWYKEAVKWATERSPMTPVHFLQAGIVWLIGLAVARRVCIALHEKIFPHLYVLIIAETSKYAKSTGLNTLYSLLVTAMPHMTIPGQTTPEGLVELLSGQLPSNFDKLSKTDQMIIEAGRQFSGQRGIMLDEISSFLGANKKDYMTGFVELLMRLYDAREYEAHYTRSGGMMYIKHPGISILGATTPSAMARACNYEVWENGANARYLMMFREQPLRYNPNYISDAPPPSVVKPLSTLHNALPKMKGDLNEELSFDLHYAMMTPEAFQQYQRYTQAVYYDMITDELDQRLHGNYRRMHIQMLKIALGLACMDWIDAGGTGKVVIELGHVALGQQLAETSRASLHRLMPVLSESDDTRTQRDLLVVLKHSHGGLTLRDINRRIGRNTRDLRSALEVLVESGEVELIEHRPSTGRPTQLYQVCAAF